MKLKIICLLLFIISFTYLTGCMNVAHITAEQSAENFKLNKGEIEDICEKDNVKIINNKKKSHQ